MPQPIFKFILLLELLFSGRQLGLQIPVLLERFLFVLVLCLHLNYEALSDLTLLITPLLQLVQTILVIFALPCHLSFVFLSGLDQLRVRMLTFTKPVFVVFLRALQLAQEISFRALVSLLGLAQRLLHRVEFLLNLRALLIDSLQLRLVLLASLLVGLFNIQKFLRFSLAFLVHVIETRTHLVVLLLKMTQLFGHLRQFFPSFRRFLVGS